MMALSQAFTATGEQGYADRAERLLDAILSWADDLSCLGRPALPGQIPESSLAVPMILLNVIDELCSCVDGQRTKAKYKAKAEWCVAKATAHMVPDRQIVLESVSPAGLPQLDTPEGRLLNPGHAIEVRPLPLPLLSLSLPLSPSPFLSLPPRLSRSLSVCMSQLLFACLNYGLPVSTTVCLSQLLFAL